MEIEVSMLRADMVKDARDRPPNAGIETLHRIDGRPEVDTLEGSRHANMKELRVKVLKVQWRFAFAFDPSRKAVVLCGGAKSGMSQKLFYKTLIDLADKRHDDHLAKLEKKHGRSGQTDKKSSR